MEFASKGVAGAGLGTGIAGLSLGVLNAMGNYGGLNGLFGGNCNRGSGMDAAAMAAMAAGMTSIAACTGSRGGCCSENTPVNRYELQQEQKISELQSQVALRDASIYTDQKIAALNDRVSDTLRKHEEKLCEQAAYNAANTSALSCMSGQIQQLFGLTKLVVPNTSVCPGWGEVTVTPTTTTGAAAAKD